MSVAYIITIDCDWCGHEESETFYDITDAPEGNDFAMDQYFWVGEIAGEYIMLCEDCSEDVSFCEDCGESFPSEDMYYCDDGNSRCYGCREEHHEYIEEQLEDEENTTEMWVCDNCGISNPGYSEYTATWSLQ